MGQLKQGTVGAPSNVIQRKRNLEGSETGSRVRQDDTTSAEKRGDCFCPSATTRVLDKNPGFGSVKPTKNDHTSNKGLDTLSSDSRNDPLPSQNGNKIELNQMRNREHIVDGTPLVTDGKTTSYLK